MVGGSLNLCMIEEKHFFCLFQGPWMMSMKKKMCFTVCPKLLEETILNYRNDVNHVAQLKVDLFFVDIVLQLQNLL
jgi:hypothetical protein